MRIKSYKSIIDKYSELETTHRNQLIKDERGDSGERSSVELENGGVLAKQEANRRKQDNPQGELRFPNRHD